MDGLSNDAVRALLKRSMSMLAAIPPSAAKRTQRLPVNLFGDGIPTDAHSMTISGTPRMDEVFAFASKSLSTTRFSRGREPTRVCFPFGEQSLPLTLYSVSEGESRFGAFGYHSRQS